MQFVEAQGLTYGKNKSGSGQFSLEVTIGETTTSAPVPVLQPSQNLVEAGGGVISEPRHHLRTQFRQKNIESPSFAAVRWGPEGAAVVMANRGKISVLDVAHRYPPTSFWDTSFRAAKKSYYRPQTLFPGGIEDGQHIEITAETKTDPPKPTRAVLRWTRV